MRTLRRQSRIEEVPVVAKVTSPALPDTKEATQTSSKVVAQPVAEVVANYQQSDSKPVARTSSREWLKNKTGSKVVAQPVAEVVANYQQSDSKLVAKTSFSELSVLQRNVLLIIHQSCKYQGQKITQPLSIEFLASSNKTTIGTVKNAIHRLVDKEIISKEKFKNGRGGWTQYRLSDAIYNELTFLESSSKVIANWEQSSSKVVAKLVAQPVADSLSSSYINNTTTNYQAAASETISLKIPDELKKLGFSENHLMQLKRDSKLAQESISASIEALAYDLTFDDVKKKIRSPIGLIMKLLKAGEMYLSEKGFESEEDRLFRECVQRAEKQNEEKKKLLEKFFDLKFEEWIEPISDNELLKISQPVGEFKGPIHLQQLREHFRKEVFAIPSL